MNRGCCDRISLSQFDTVANSVNGVLRASTVAIYSLTTRQPAILSSMLRCSDNGRLEVLRKRAEIVTRDRASSVAKVWRVKRIRHSVEMPTSPAFGFESGMCLCNTNATGISLRHALFICKHSHECRRYSPGSCLNTNGAGVVLSQAFGRLCV